MLTKEAQFQQAFFKFFKFNKTPDGENFNKIIKSLKSMYKNFNNNRCLTTQYK